ncbi:MAG: hypothetical protein ACE5I9_00370 [Candidatus Methylomirabilales bacterium]
MAYSDATLLGEVGVYGDQTLAERVYAQAEGFECLRAQQPVALQDLTLSPYFQAKRILPVVLPLNMPNGW